MKRLHRPGAAMVVALTALFVALGGTGVAATQGLIPGTQIKDHSIAAVKLTSNALKSLRGNVGPAGDIGPAGSTGVSGGFDPSKIAYIVGPSVTIPAETVGFADATCPAGSVVIGGGFFNSITAVGGGSAAPDERCPSEQRLARDRQQQHGDPGDRVRDCDLRRAVTEKL